MLKEKEKSIMSEKEDNKDVSSVPKETPKKKS